MIRLSPPHVALSVCVATLLAACGGSQTPLGTSGAVSPSYAAAQRTIASSAANGLLAFSPTRPKTLPASVRGGPEPAAQEGAHLIYSGDDSDNVITIYSSLGVNPPPLGFIENSVYGPERLFVNKNLNLYVTNQGNYTIAVYAPGTTTPSLEISSGVEDPTGLVVGADGTVYCANVGNSTVTEYPEGQRSPSITLNVTEGFPENLAIDSHNNLYVQYIGGGGGVTEFAPGSVIGKNLNLDLTPDEVGGLEVDRSGNIIIIDGSTIDVFQAGHTEPSRKIRVKGAYPFELSLSKDEKKLYVSVLIRTSFAIQELRYPDGTTLRNKISDVGYGGWPLAVSPDNAL